MNALQPRCKAKNTDVFCQLDRFRLASYIVYLLVVFWLFFTMPVSPWIRLAGYEKADDSSYYHYKHKNFVQVGKQRQINSKSNQIREQRGHGCPDMFTGLTVTGYSIVCSAPELLNIGIEHIGIGGCISLFVDLYNDSSANCYSSV